MSPPVIELREVSISFNQQQVLRNVNFHLHEGETKIILGGSGQGKSTILRLVLGLEKPDEGEVLINGTSISALPEEELVPIRKQMGMVFQESSLFDSLNVYENISYSLQEDGKSEEEILKITNQLLHRVDLEEGDLEKLPMQLSGGMKRRVAMARAMAGVHRIMLYDEPTAGLDPITSRHITELIIRLRDLEKVTALVVTQDVISSFQIITHCAHRDSSGKISIGDHPDHACTNKTSLLILRDGHILVEGKLEQLLKSSDSYIQEFLSTLKMIATLR